MGYLFRQIVLMIMVVVISLQCCRVSRFGIVIVADAEDLEEWRLLMVANGRRDRTLIGNVAGEDEDEKKELRILEKFRALLDLIKSSTSPPSLESSDSLSPWPAPAPAPSPGGGNYESPAYSPAPIRPFHPHFHRPLPQTGYRWRPHEIQRRKREEGTGKKIIVPVLIATASGIGFVACVVGLLCLGVKIRKKKKKKNSETTSFMGKKGKSQNSSTRKVSVNPTLDYLYLNSVGVDLERQCSVSVKERGTAKKGLQYDNGRLLEGEVKNRGEGILPESDNASSSSTKEIVSVHENDEQGVVVPRESDSSDNESFHSLCASQSLRLSNASANSAVESSEHFPEREREIQESYGKDLGIPPPPPPPPPLPQFSDRRIHNLTSPETVSVASSSHKPRPNRPTLLPELSEKSSDSSSTTDLQTLSPHPSEKASSSSSSTDLQTHLPPGSSLCTNVQTPSCPPPPPPPPRPLPLAGSNKMTPPPPLSLDFSQRAPLGKDGAPLPKLKPLHWDKVRATPERSMVWDKLRTSSFELDEEMIESLFGYTMQSSMKNDEGKSKTPSPGKHLLEPKRLQNITILLKALNATTEQVCTALIKGEGLCLQQLEALVRMVPTKEEESKLCSYKGAIDELGSAERFIRALFGVPFAFQRAEAMLYRETFDDEVVHLRNSFSMLEEACKELKSSRLFLKLLEAVLKTGNRMNIGTIRGGAKAFKLDALLKLSDVKGTDGKTTLLHFVVQEISRSEGIRVSDSIMGRIMNQRPNKNRTNEEKEEDYRRMGLDLVSGLNTELQNVKKTATIDLDVLTSSVLNLRDGLLKMRSLAREKLCGEEESDRTFVGSLSLFLRKAEKDVEALREDEKRVMEQVSEIKEYFHGDGRGDDKNPLRIFVIVRDFLGMLDHVCRELRCVRVPSSPSPLAPFR